MTKTKILMTSIIALTVLIGITANYAIAADVEVIEGTITGNGQDFHKWALTGTDASSTLEVTLVCGNTGNASEELDPYLSVQSPTISKSNDDGLTDCDSFQSSIVNYGAGDVEDGCWVTESDGTGSGQNGPYTLTLDLQGPGTITPDGIVTSLDGCTIEVNVDLKPQSCPNPINVHSKGLVPVAILGSATFDVNDIDISTLPARTEKHTIEDVATPFNGPLVSKLSCTEEGPDGFDDLIFKIPTSELNCLPDGLLAILTIDGVLLDGTPFTGMDTGFVINKNGCS